jgi:hypothetical protein
MPSPRISLSARGPLAALGATLVLSACGGSHPSRIAPTAPASTSAQTSPAPAAPRHVRHRGSHPRATRPHAHPHTTTTAAPGAPAPAAAHLPVSRFTYIANATCRSVSGGGPAAPPPAGRRALRRYAAVAMPAAERISVTLRRVAAQTRNLQHVGPLLADYQALVVLYQRVRSGGSSTPTAGDITTPRRRTAAAARTLHLPLCAPGALAAG